MLIMLSKLYMWLRLYWFRQCLLWHGFKEPDLAPNHFMKNAIISDYQFHVHICLNLKTIRVHRMRISTMYCTYGNYNESLTVGLINWRKIISYIRRNEGWLDDN